MKSCALAVHEKGKAALCRDLVALQGGVALELQTHAPNLAPPMRWRLGGTGSAAVVRSEADLATDGSQCVDFWTVQVSFLPAPTHVRSSLGFFKEFGCFSFGIP